MNAFTKIISTMYIRNKLFFTRSANFVLSKCYYVPLEADDLISNCLQELIIIAEKFENKNERSLEQLLFSSTKFIMYSYCRSYTNRNNEILNNYINFDLIENYQGNNYNVPNLNIDYLSDYQKNIINDLFENKIKTRNVALKYNTTSTSINREIEKIRQIIKIKLDNTIDNT